MPTGAEIWSVELAMVVTTGDCAYPEMRRICWPAVSATMASRPLLASAIDEMARPGWVMTRWVDPSEQSVSNAPEPAADVPRMAHWPASSTTPAATGPRRLLVETAAERTGVA